MMITYYNKIKKIKMNFKILCKSLLSLIFRMKLLERISNKLNN